MRKNEQERRSIEKKRNTARISKRKMEEYEI